MPKDEINYKSLNTNIPNDIISKINAIHSETLPKKEKDFLTKVSKIGDRSRGRPKGSLFNSYYTEV